MTGNGNEMTRNHQGDELSVVLPLTLFLKFLQVRSTDRDWDLVNSIIFFSFSNTHPYTFS